MDPEWNDIVLEGNEAVRVLEGNQHHLFSMPSTWTKKEFFMLHWSHMKVRIP